MAKYSRVFCTLYLSFFIFLKKNNRCIKPDPIHARLQIVFPSAVGQRANKSCLQQVSKPVEPVQLVHQISSETVFRTKRMVDFGQGWLKVKAETLGPRLHRLVNFIIRRVRNSQTSFPSHLIPYPQPATGNRLRHASGPVPWTGNLRYPPIHLYVTSMV